MALFVDQFVYTSFPNIGFQLFSSGKISPQLQQFFLEMIVDRCWNAYQPPPSAYQAAFLRQVDTENTLFGWFYNDIEDDFDRVNVPYFLCYHSDRSLTAQLLNQIFTCLQKGPINKVSRQNLLSDHLNPVYLSDRNEYQSAEMGVKISSVIRQYSLVNLQQKKLLNLLIPAQTASTNPLEIIFHNAIARKMGILGGVLVTQTGQFLTQPINLDLETKLFITNVTKDLNSRQLQPSQCQPTKPIFLKSRDGYLILSNCDPKLFLFVKAELILESILKGQIDDLINKLQPEIHKIQAKIYSYE